MNRRLSPLLYFAGSAPRSLWTAVLLAACSGEDAVRPNPTGGGGRADSTIRVEIVASGLSSPLYLTSPAADPRLFIVEQPGRVRIVKNGQLLARPFLDIGDRVKAGGEQGLLGLAFHPRYDQNGFFYVDYTDRTGDTRVERYQVSASDPDVAERQSARLILFQQQPFANHNGGMLLFGPDHKLYIGLGDGGSGGDPQGNGQNLGTLLGKILRIDIDAGDPYAVPPDNPFVGRTGARGEIWAYGLRNPWRFAFDSASGTLLIGDVGQNAWEEVDAAPASAGGLNYGWNRLEATHCYASSTCDSTGTVRPVLEYGHGEGCAVTAGFVYRGKAAPALAGQYVYSDYCAGWVRSFELQGGAATNLRTWDVGDVGQVLSYGVDSGGELYLLSSNGNVYRFAAAK